MTWLSFSPFHTLTDLFFPLALVLALGWWWHYSSQLDRLLSSDQHLHLWHRWC